MSFNDIDTASELYKKILEGKIKRFPQHFWSGPGAEDNAKEVTKYFIEKVLKWNSEDIKGNLTEAVFRKHKLSGMLEYTFDRSPFKAIDNAYPGKFKEWEFKAVPKHLWENTSKREEAIRWLLEKTNKDKFDELTNVEFIEYGLGGLMDYLHKKKEFANINIKNIENGIKHNKRDLKVTFNKSGGTSSRNGVTTRLTLPTSWVRELGITEEDREVEIELVDKSIIIKKKTSTSYNKVFK